MASSMSPPTLETQSAQLSNVNTPTSKVGTVTNDDDDDDDSGLEHTWRSRLKVSAFVITNTIVNDIMDSLHVYPHLYLTYMLDQALVSSIVGVPCTPWNWRNIFAGGGFRQMYHGFIPFAMFNVIESVAGVLPTLSVRLGLVDSQEAERVVDWGNWISIYVINSLIRIPFEMMHARCMNPIQSSTATPATTAAIRTAGLSTAVATSTVTTLTDVVKTMAAAGVTTTSFLGVRWWVVLSSAFLDIDFASNWRHYLPETHPLADRRSVFEAVMATKLYWPALVMLIELNPFPDVDDGPLLRLTIDTLVAMVPGYAVGFVVRMLAQIVWQRIRGVVIANVFEDAEHHLERHLQQAADNVGQVRGRVKLSKDDRTAYVQMTNRSNSGSGLRQLESQANRDASLKTLEEKREALYERLDKQYAKLALLDVDNEIIIEADREDVLSSFQQIALAPRSTLLSPEGISVEFKGEYGLDYGGVFRSYMGAVSKALATSPTLFKPGPDNGLLPVKQTRDESDGPHRSPADEQLFAVGRLLALAITRSTPLDVCFSRCLFKVLLGETITPSDVARIDPEFAKNQIGTLLTEGGVRMMEEVLSGSEDPESMYFVDPNTDEEVVEGGKRIRVTERNKARYVQALVEHKLVGHCRAELAMIIEGFYDIIPKKMLCDSEDDHRINATDLELLVAGLPQIDVDDWRTHCAGVLMTDDTYADLREWFWEIIGSYTYEQRARLLSFTTGSGRLPITGFTELDPPFNIDVTAAPLGHLPSAHTCTNQLCLPGYTSKDQLAERLNIAIQHGDDAGFGFA
eukprot:m.161767 g.161767  ORF g.161767 m.161767 type:complete len:799 (-) comp31253_c3_seq1:1230-3626(-)